MTETVLCPTCNVEPTDVDGKLVCTECYKVIDRPSGSQPLRQSAPANPAPAPPSAPAPERTRPDPNAPLVAPPPVRPVATGPKTCPTCNVDCTDVDGKMVCTKCYRIIDQPELAIISNAPTNYKQGIQSFAIVVTIFLLVVLFFLVQWMSRTPPQP